MKATITSTDQYVAIDALAEDQSRVAARPGPAVRSRVMARAWEGVTEKGTRFIAYIAIVQAATEDDNTEFERDLKADVHKAPDDWSKRAIDMRFFVD